MLQSRATQVVIFVVLLVVGIWAIAINDVYNARREIIGEALARDRATAATLALQAAQTLTQIDQMLRTLARDLAVIDNGLARRNLRIHDMLASRAESEPGVASIIVTDRDGIVRWSSRTPSPPPVSLAGLKAFQGPASDPGDGSLLAAASPLRLANLAEAPGFGLSRRLVDGPDGLSGVIIAAMPITLFTDIYAKLLVGPGRSIALWRDDGALLAIAPDDGRGYPRQARDQAVDDDALRSTEAVPGFPAHVVVTTSRSVLLAERWGGMMRRVLFFAMARTLVVIAVGWWFWRTERRAASDRASEQRAKDQLAAVIGALDELVWRYDPDAGRLTILGTGSDDEAPSRARLRADLEAAFAGQPDLDVTPLGKAAWCPSERMIEHQVMQPDGSLHWLLVRGKGVADADGRIVEIEGIAGDITDRKVGEAAVQRSRRLEAIGLLSGGVAHDFNNLLGIIIGNLELIEKAVSRTPALTSRVEAALGAALRGADLTAKLLGFSRPHAERREVTDVNAVIASMRDLIKPALPATISLLLDLDGRPCISRLDPGGLQDALMNLALNARDAMPEGGKLIIATRQRPVTADEAPGLEQSAPHRHVIVSVRDTGTGMAPEVLERIFDPYYTTKEHGRGTGLGLSQVQAFARSAEGAVKARSTIGRGSEFLLYLPVTEETLPERAAAPSADLPGGTETILLVDDEPDLLGTAARQLELLGYRVITAANGSDALAILDGGVSIDLMLSDVTMPPPLDGVALARTARQRHPGLPILLASGFFGDTLDWHDVPGDPPRILDKPLSLDVLARAVRTALNAAPAGNPEEFEK